MHIESTTRSVLKSLSWRASATLATIVLVFFITGKLQIAVAIGGIEIVLKFFLYFLHERVWNLVRFGRVEVQPVVYWLTGLHASGKVELGDALYEELLKRGYKVERLSGESVRELFPGTGFTKEARDIHIQRIGHLASRLEANGVFVVASFISPYKEARAFARKLCRRFVEVYVSTPIDVCEKRDKKGLYRKARNGELPNFTGISDPYEPPDAPDIEIDMTELSPEGGVRKVLS